MGHFTYENVPDKSNLKQGDLLERTPEINQILAEFHPHYYTNEKNKYFAVLTQSCDLIRRNGLPLSTPYITIASVRHINEAINREVEKKQLSKYEQKFDYLTDRTRPKLKQFLERIYNNNESKYFFYSQDIDHGLEDDYCAFLELSIPLKSAEHYEKLLNAKKLQLKESFQHKLGYLVGNNYARVGTEDWVPDNISPDEFSEKIEIYLNSDEIVWISDEIHKELTKRLKSRELTDINDKDFSDLVKVIREEQKKRVESILKIVEDEMSILNIEIPMIQKIKGRLLNNVLFRSKIK
jgi:hypothetical protein